MKSKAEITAIITEQLVEIIPELEGVTVDPNETLESIGANSLDRGELIAMSLEALELEIPRIKFVDAESIAELTELMHSNQG